MKYKPGETCPKTCYCCMCDKSGNKINTVEMQKGQTLPPTPNAGDYYDINE